MMFIDIFEQADRLLCLWLQVINSRRELELAVRPIKS